MPRQMKDSGVEWIGQIPTEWDIRKIKKSFAIYAGATPKSENNEFFDGEIVWVTPADYKTADKYVSNGRRNLSEAGYKSCGTTLVPKGSVIFSKRAPIGSVAIATQSLCTNQGCLACVPTKENDSTYFYYAMSVFTDEFNLMGTGTTFKEISANAFANFELPYPQPEIQKMISDFLDAKCYHIDSVLEQTRACIEEYKKLKQAVIVQAVTKGIRGERPMKPSEIEWLDVIPESWSECRIKNAIFPTQKDITPDDEIVTCFRDGEVTLRKNRREDGFTISFTEHGYHGVDVGDLVIHGMDAFAGAIGCSDSRGKTTPVVHVCSTIGNNRYFMYFLRCMAFGDILMDLSNGVRIRSSDYRNFAKLAVFRVAVPAIEEQNEIVDYLDQKIAGIDNLIVKKEKFIAELENYKKSMIYEYVTGKKEVPQS